MTMKQFSGKALSLALLACLSLGSSVTAADMVAEIDKALSDQLNEIMHHESFQKLEASWRGLHYMVHESETGTNLTIRLDDGSLTEAIVASRPFYDPDNTRQIISTES